MQVDSILDCSAKTMDRVEYVFQKAQSAYIYPVLPIYNMRKDKLRVSIHENEIPRNSPKKKKTQGEGEN